MQISPVQNQNVNFTAKLENVEKILENSIQSFRMKNGKVPSAKQIASWRKLMNNLPGDKNTSIKLFHKDHVIMKKNSCPKCEPVPERWNINTMMEVTNNLFPKGKVVNWSLSEKALPLDIDAVKLITKNIMSKAEKWFTESKSPKQIFENLRSTQNK